MVAAIAQNLYVWFVVLLLFYSMAWPLFHYGEYRILLLYARLVWACLRFVLSFKGLI